MMLIFGRHAQTEAGAKNKFEGASDSPLTLLGKKQAKILAEFCQKNKIKKIYSSPTGRALKTAKIVSKICHLKLKTINDLKEICYGEWEGKTRGALKDKSIWQERSKNFFKFVNPGSYNETKGQSYEMLYERVKPLFKKLEKEKEFPILIVSHVGVVRCAKKYFDKANNEEFQRFTIPNDYVFLVSKKEKIKTKLLRL